MSCNHDRSSVTPVIIWKLCTVLNFHPTIFIQVKIGNLTTKTAEICVEPTIKFAHDYQDENSAAAANLAMQMQVRKSFTFNNFHLYIVFK